MKIDLTDNAIDEYLGMYTKYLEDIQGINTNTANQLYDLVRETKYDKLQQIVGELIDKYIETVMTKLENSVFDAWEESKGSLAACLDMYEAGVNAINVCKNIQNKMREALAEKVKLNKQDSVETKNPKVREEDLERLEQIIVAAKENLETLHKDCNTKIQTAESENEIFGSLSALTEGIYEQIYHFYEASANRGKDFNQFVKKTADTIRKAADEVADGMKGKEEGDAGVAGGTPEGSASNGGASAGNAASTQNAGDSAGAENSASDDAASSAGDGADDSASDDVASNAGDGADDSASDDAATSAGDSGDDSAADDAASNAGDGAGDSGDDSASDDVASSAGDSGDDSAADDATASAGDGADDSAADDAAASTGDSGDDSAADDAAASAGDAAANSASRDTGNDTASNSASGDAGNNTASNSAAGNAGDAGNNTAANSATGNAGDAGNNTAANSASGDAGNNTASNSAAGNAGDTGNTTASNSASGDAGNNAAANSAAGNAGDAGNTTASNSAAGNAGDAGNNTAANSASGDAGNNTAANSAAGNAGDTGNTTASNSASGDAGNNAAANSAAGNAGDAGNNAAANSAAGNAGGAGNTTTNSTAGNAGTTAGNSAPGSVTGNSVPTPGTPNLQQSQAASAVTPTPHRLAANSNPVPITANNANDAASFSQENVRLFLQIIERILDYAGVDNLNSALNSSYNNLNSSRSRYSGSSQNVRPTSRRQQTTAAASGPKYGRYTVTNNMLQELVPMYDYIKMVMDNSDQFYKEKFQSLDQGYDKVNEAVHDLSTFIGMWGLGTWDLQELFTNGETTKSILDMIKLGGIALSSYTTVGKIAIGGAGMVKVLDKCMPYMKKSSVITKVNEKIWNLTRQDMQIPYIQRAMDQYIMEHYEIANGRKNKKSGYFPYYHMAVSKINDEQQRRALETAAFTVENFMVYHCYNVNAANEKESWERWRGIQLNLARAAIGADRNIDSEKANELIDILYGIYTYTENIRPRVDADPNKYRVR